MLFELGMYLTSAMVRFAGYPAAKRRNLPMSLGLTIYVANLWIYGT